ncbi:hypothetical protein [Noviherbaspirillum suwonense]|uniref:hypothetical protein n=1 Tax=Noviherbaspirillum suwonense TaxID=1224511 RepID=UPI0024B67731|nr:hypothetical protein [Noviherbaspirillum suwonense]
MNKSLKIVNVDDQPSAAAYGPMHSNTGRGAIQRQKWEQKRMPKVERHKKSPQAFQHRAQHIRVEQMREDIEHHHTGYINPAFTRH